MTTLIRDVADLPDGARIPTTDPDVGDLTVVSTCDDCVNGRLMCVEVDVVTGDPNVDIRDMTALASLVGADSALRLGNPPTRRYRLYFEPDATVTTIDGR